MPVYCNPLTADAIRTRGICVSHEPAALHHRRGDFSVKDITIQTFPVPHDAANTGRVGATTPHSSLGFCTDLGFATKLVFERIREVQTLVIETNHDEKMLQNDTRRPWAVKQRIMSRHGHLSNDAAAGVLSELLGNGLRRAILCHLSRDCNSPEFALPPSAPGWSKPGIRRRSLLRVAVRGQPSVFTGVVKFPSGGMASRKDAKAQSLLPCNSFAASRLCVRPCL